jgi:hypothetical protein
MPAQGSRAGADTVAPNAGPIPEPEDSDFGGAEIAPFAGRIASG